MGANATAAIAALTHLKQVFTTVETGIQTGDSEIDAVTRRLLSDPSIGRYLATIYDNGSRAQQNAHAAAVAASSGITPTQDPDYTQLEAFIRRINVQLVILANPSREPRRQHVTLQ